jgi:hypothetical protein
VELISFFTQYFCVINVREELSDLDLPLLKSIRKWLNELMKEEAQIEDHIVSDEGFSIFF